MAFYCGKDHSGGLLEAELGALTAVDCSQEAATTAGQVNSKSA